VIDYINYIIVLGEKKDRKRKKEIKDYLYNPRY
jgi:hypothetical protein